MALTSRSLLLYGLQVTELNRSLDFQTVMAGPIKLATLRLGFYSITNLLREIERAMFEADPTIVPTASVNRNVGGGTENRISITTSSGFLSLLFFSGPRAASACHGLIGFTFADQTGSTSYTGSSSIGVPLVSEFPGYNYLGPEFEQKVFGNVNVSASGIKEATVFQVQRFVSVQFKYEPKAKVIDEWLPWNQWAMQQRPFEFTPEVGDPDTVYNVTMERNPKDGKGLGFLMKEMLPRFPNEYDTGVMQFRLIGEA